MPNEADRWQQLLDQHGPALLLFARQWSASRADAEDALQNGFLKFWKLRSSAKDELSLLYASVRSAAMDIGRGDRRRDVRERSVAAEESSPFEPCAERVERDALIEAALKQLPGDQREVIVMKIWGGLTFAQIAAALHVPLSTAASRYRYAVARLSQDLSEELAHE